MPAAIELRLNTNPTLQALNEQAAVEASLSPVMPQVGSNLVYAAIQHGGKADMRRANAVSCTPISGCQ